ncbi:MAG TPA: DUF1844 domain-containing protein [Polyangia bacterium]|jgi:hypothetical protein|nr:DUF1844 domain-containing protein [Polyangia bacterium]
MSSDAKDGKAGFTVNDRRIFADEKGEARVEQTSPPAAQAQTAPPAIDFHTFVLSLGSSALLHLGELERPGAAGPEIDLPMAKNTIDILSMLQDKTRGNLTPEEQKLIEGLVYDLKLRYVERAGGTSSPPRSPPSK